MKIIKFIALVFLFMATSFRCFSFTADSLYFTKIQSLFSLPVHNINEMAPARSPDIDLLGTSIYNNELKHDLFKKETLVFDELNELISFAYQVRYSKLYKSKDRIIKEIKSIYGEADSIYGMVDYDKVDWKVFRFRKGKEVVILHITDPNLSDMKIEFRLSNNLKVKTKVDEFDKTTLYSIINNTPIDTKEGDRVNILVMGLKGSHSIYLSLSGGGANFNLSKFQILTDGGNVINIDVNSKIVLSKEYDLLKSSIVLLDQNSIDKILNSKLVRFRASGDVDNYTFSLSQDFRSALVLMKQKLE